MSVTVYVWDGNLSTKSMGHTAMKVDRDYFTWWPKGVPRGVFTIAAPIEGRTFADDLRDERGWPENSVVLQGLDEAAIRVWWQELFSRKFGTIGLQAWHGLSFNCATSVAHALKAGGAKGGWRLIWTPADILAWAQQLSTAAASG